ncbi:MAG: 2-hydroxyacyl-CoA dehydratase family protein [Desulfobulbus sp.]|nr:2-hydroxyacyl-CoA dehydratase family protein [Desulfobulbus sp.]
MTGNMDRQSRLKLRLEEKCQMELARELDMLVARDDYRPELAYFLDLFRTGFSPASVARRVDRPVVNLLCLQAPLELFLACGLHPYKFSSGSLAAGQIAAPKLPALMCPMLRSVLGALESEAAADSGHPWVLPTTCD